MSTPRKERPLGLAAGTQKKKGCGEENRSQIKTGLNQAPLNYSLTV